MVKVAVQEVEALQGGDDLLALAALAAEYCFDHHVGGDDVRIAGDGAGDFVGADLEVLFGEEGGEGHGSECVGSGPPLRCNKCTTAVAQVGRGPKPPT